MKLQEDRIHDMLTQANELAAVRGWNSSSGLEQSEQLQVGDVFDDDGRRDVRDVVVGADFGFVHRSTESVGRREGPADRLYGLQRIGIVQ